MSNYFNIDKVRFKLGNQRTLFIQGWFDESKIGKIKVFLDDVELSKTIDEIQKQNIYVKRAKAKYAISTRYNITINLPMDLLNYKDVLIRLYEGQEIKREKRISVKKILSTSRRIAYNVTSSEIKNGMPIIRGWIASVFAARIKAYSMQGRPVECQVFQKFSKQILLEYPEVENGNTMEFTIKFPNCSEKRIMLVIETENKEYVIKCGLYYGICGKIISKGEKLTKKGLTYYKRNGLSETVKKIYVKATNRKQINYGKWRILHGLTEAQLNEQRNQRFEYEPKISLVIPLYKTPSTYLEELIEAIIKQTYTNWELCLSDGSGKVTSMRTLIEEYSKKDKRVKYVYSAEPLKISDNTNAAIAIATGEWIGFADHDDVLSPDALYENVKAMNRTRSIDFIYSDEDKVSMNGKEYFEPHFKPDFNYDLLNTTNYICHLVMVSRNLLNDVGGLNSDYDGAQDYDFVLRCTEKTENIYHISKVLYHWRAHKDSTAENPESKRYAFEAGKRAIEAHYSRLNVKTIVSETEFLGIYRTQYILENKPKVSVVIPNKDHVGDLRKCVESIRNTGYSNLEYIIIENNSNENETFDYYEELQKEEKRAKVIYWEKEFNYSAINNYGVGSAEGEFYLFLNNDTEIINKDCIEELLGYAMRKEVGVVGARLYYPDNTIQHAGVVIGVGGLAGHIFTGMHKEEPGYFARAFCAQDYSAVTAACMMVRKDVFEEVNGFDEQIKVAFNDIDFCLRVRESGKLVVYNPYAELYHYESKSRGKEDTQEKRRRFEQEVAVVTKRYLGLLEKGDPYYNQNLSLEKGDCRLKK